MTLRTPASWMQGGTHPAENDRLTLRGLVGSQGVGVGAEELQITQAVSPAMTALVAAGWAWVLGTTSANQGMYSSYNDAPVTVPITSAHATLARIDLVCLSIRDAAYVGGAFNDCILQVIAGTPSGSPVAPALPASSLSLATIAVGAAVTSIVNANITDTRTRAALAMAATSNYKSALLLGGM